MFYVKLCLTPQDLLLYACMLPDPQDSMTSFSVSDDGQLYSALTSNNTCALLDVGVSQGKAAWEFLLEDDSPRYDAGVLSMFVFVSPSVPSSQ